MKTKYLNLEILKPPKSLLFIKILVFFSGENLPVNKKAAIHCPALVKM
jgi:hypothetical protein